LAAGASAVAASSPVVPNRTVPKVDLPRSALEFSANPTPQELFRARVFEEPLVPIGGEPNAAENAALAAALLGYSKRSGPDDFSSLTGFLEKHPKSSWSAALLTDLGLEYYNTAHYSLALEAWARAWSHAKDVTDARGKALMDRAAGELAYMYARLGRMTELEPLLNSVEGRVFFGASTEKIAGAREGLWNMKHHPEISFRCGPLALHRIKLAVDASNPATEIINESASTQQGFSLAQVADLSKKVGLNYQMAFRGQVGTRSTASPTKIENGTRWNASLPFIVPSVVHWKVGHYAAIVRREGERYLLQDPTFRNDVWATRQALEAETSGYFLIPPGPVPQGWRKVETSEGETIWGKGNTAQSDPGPINCKDPQSGGSDSCNPDSCPDGVGMAVSSVHFMTVNLSITDEPVGYSPPVGPPVRFKVRYNSRDAFQPANFNYANLGSKWTCDWISYITDNPSNTLADVSYYARGGGTRTFTGFNTNTQAFAYQQYDQTRLTRTGSASYELLAGNGSKLVFTNSTGASGTSRKVFLSQVLDPAGNAVMLTYDAHFRLVAITDAIGQVTTLSYSSDVRESPDYYLVTRVTDPFGRFATFQYQYVQAEYIGTNPPVYVCGGFYEMSKITDVLGLVSQFVTNCSGTIHQMVTPYGTTTFNGASGPDPTTRVLETVYPDGSRDRVEFNQTIAISNTVPAASVPMGMSTFSLNLMFRNTYYWSRNACATGYGDYSKARLYHWLHTTDLSTTSGILESTKEALEGRVWYDYAGQSAPYIVGSNNVPSHVGRVLDDGSTQLYSYEYDAFGHVTRAIDPIGRTMSYIYSTNGIDLLEVRQTRGTNNELLARTTYNAQHLPLTKTDAAGQTTTNTYNVRGQVLTSSNPKGESVTNTYDTNGYRVMVDGPLAGTNDVGTASYDAFGRVLTKTDVSGYTLTFEHDDLDRLTKITHPDSTFEQVTYNRLDASLVRDRAGRQTLLEFDSMRQMTKRTDPLNRMTLFQWCSCGAIKSLTDPLGRTTMWNKDVQGRLSSKQYGDGSQVTYFYENTSSRVRQVIDEKQQVTEYSYNRDNTLKSIAYANTSVPTPSVAYTYDPNYERFASMTDGIGATVYAYNPITGSPTLGAGQLASEDGPLPDDTITYGYDELGHRTYRAVNGAGATRTYDQAGRMIGETNALGAFTYSYDGASARLLTNTSPNGQSLERSYAGNLEDRLLQRITHKVGATPVSEFFYGRDIPANRITAWSQQAGAQSPSLYSFGYDAANQLLSAAVTNAGSFVNSFAYSYDPAGNRLTEQAGAATNTATYNALNQISTTSGPGTSRTNEWDGEDRLASVNAGNQRTEFIYDGQGRMVAIRQLTNGVQVSLRRFVWCQNEICEQRDGSGAVTKRFFQQGMKVEMGVNTGAYYYTRDHLGSIREVTDISGNVRARYAYDPYGRRTRLTGDLEADFGFTGMFWTSEAGLALTRFRAYDPELGRWLSRDPLKDAEMREGPSLYVYVADNPINLVDSLGLWCEAERALRDAAESALRDCKDLYSPEELNIRCVWKHLFATSEIAADLCAGEKERARICADVVSAFELAGDILYQCQRKHHCVPFTPDPYIPRHPLNPMSVD
jgi:RHS repeat-associated protein